MENQTAMRRCALAMSASIFAVSAPNVFAQDRGVVFAGGAASADRSLGAGFTAALPGARLGQGWAVRASAFAGDYSYDGGPGWIDADFAGGELAAVYQSSGAWGYANLAAGPRFTDTNLSPDDPGNEREGSNWDVAVTADAGRTIGPWHFTAYVSYGVRLSEYYSRVDVSHAVGSSGFGLGAEIGAEGDDDYSRSQIGAMARFSPPTNLWIVKVSGGVRRGEGQSDGYGAFSVSRNF